MIAAIRNIAPGREEEALEPCRNQVATLLKEGALA